MTLRRFLFWVHLTAGCVPGWSFRHVSDGILLAYRRQIIRWETAASKLNLPRGLSAYAWRTCSRRLRKRKDDRLSTLRYARTLSLGGVDLDVNGPCS